MNAKSLKYWLSKFVQAVVNTSGGRYPSRTLYSIVCGLKRFPVVKNGEGESVSDKRYLTVTLLFYRLYMYIYIYVKPIKPRAYTACGQNDKLFI